jgi:hypothetical protein
MVFVTTDITWHSIPGYSSYEINNKGVVRIAMNAPIAEERGKLMRLDAFVPDKSKPDEISETYTLFSDEPLLRLVSKDRLLKAAFNQIHPYEL